MTQLGGSKEYWGYRWCSIRLSWVRIHAYMNRIIIIIKFKI